MGVRAGRLVVVGTLTGLVGVYGAFSTFIVSRSLATRQVCPPASAAPAGITAEQVFYRSLSDGARMAAWFAPSSSGRAVIVVHGIDGYAGVGADTEIARAYQTGGFALLMPDLRAHGASEGTRLSLGALERGDIGGAVDFLLGRGIGPGRIGIHGTSYGAAMALLAAAEIPEIGAVVADSAYADVRDLISAQLGERLGIPLSLAKHALGPGVRIAARWVYGIHLGLLAPERAIAALDRPVLFIHGTADPVTPVEHARRLHARAGARSDLWLLEGFGHTQGVSLSPCAQIDSPVREEFLRRVVAFLDGALVQRR